ncbi:MAG: HD domain-containing protein [Planctomycetes bacterium]|nr:HD domain-containing protein [Planctomycetota bacterium]
MFSAGIERAIHVSIAAHAGQKRKGSVDTPYVVHPIHVALLLARHGADEELVQAGLLHDVVEDCPDQWNLARIAEEFGPRVAAIVGDLTEDKSKTWEERKRWAVEHVAHMSTEGAMVKAADKLHNLSALLEELSTNADHSAVWAKFKGGRERTLAMSGELVDALHARLGSTLSAELARTMQALLDVAR